MSLYKVRDKVQKIAEAIASVLKMEVEIVDTQLMRIAGTGMVRNDVGIKLRRGLINKHVLDSMEPVVIKEAGFHEICLSCPLTGECFYRASIVYPIRVREEVVGTLSLIAFSNEQKVALCNNSESLLEFVGRMADLMSSKVLEEEMFLELVTINSKLEAVVDTVHEAIVAVDQDGFITHCNISAKNLLEWHDQQVLGKKADNVLPGFPFEKVITTGISLEAKEVFLKKSVRHSHFISSIRPIKSKTGVVGAVATLKDYREAEQFAYSIVTSNQAISFDDITGVSSVLQETKDKARRIATSNSSVLILGESGTGKELFARAIHNQSAQRNKPFVAINCGAIPEALLESELFGYEGGAFTGARRGGKPGKFEIANGGTVLLDEVGNMSLYLQAKILRVLQEREIERVGGNKVIPLDFRLIAATNSDLLEMVKKGEFREDLYYRINVIPLHIPPLREREQDVNVLLNFYLNRYRSLIGKEIQGFSDNALNLCLSYSWPGNVRELVNAVEYAVNVEEGELIQPESLPPKIKDLIGGDRIFGGMKTLADIERKAIEEALNQFGWSEEGKLLAADSLGISRSTIYRKIQKYKLFSE